MGFRGPMLRASGVAALLCASGCYHYTFQQEATSAELAPGARLVTHSEREPTYLDGFVGNGTVDTSRYCADPVKTELRVTAPDVLISIATLLIYTPHTLYVTCAEPAATARSLRPRSR
jgi:hypothetical protein